MRHVNPDRWANFAARVETLCGEFLHAMEHEQYSPAEVIQAACNIIAVAINETGDKELAIQATHRWIKTCIERAKVNPTPYLN